MDWEAFKKNQAFAGPTKPSMHRRRVGPDHLHGILFVQQHMEVHMSQAVKGFKTGTNKIYRELLPSVAIMSQQKQEDMGGYRHKGFLWSPGFNDHILEDAGELDRWFEYLRDNPRRLAIRRAHADYFRVRFNLDIDGQAYAAIGNRFLLNHPQKMQVQLSRRFNDEEIKHAVDYYLALSKMGFNDFSHPGHQYYEACAEGRFLILAPWPHQNRKIALTRDMCLALNGMAKNICEANNGKF